MVFVCGRACARACGCECVCSCVCTCVGEVKCIRQQMRSSISEHIQKQHLSQNMLLFPISKKNYFPSSTSLWKSYFSIPMSGIWDSPGLDAVCFYVVFCSKERQHDLKATDAAHTLRQRDRERQNILRRKSRMKPRMKGRERENSQYMKKEKGYISSPTGARQPLHCSRWLNSPFVHDRVGMMPRWRLTTLHPRYPPVRATTADVRNTSRLSQKWHPNPYGVPGQKECAT